MARVHTVHRPPTTEAVMAAVTGAVMEATARVTALPFLLLTEPQVPPMALQVPPTALRNLPTARHHTVGTAAAVAVRAKGSVASFATR